MMNDRPIKFRVWDKNNSRWTLALVDDEGHLWGYGYKTSPTESSGREPEESGFGHYCYKLKDENFAIQKFTGLTDKNGAEVYEGDIAEYYHWVYCNKKGSLSHRNFSFEHFSFANNRRYKTIQFPQIGIVKYDEKHLTWAPIVDSYDGFYSGVSFAKVCRDDQLAQAQTGPDGIRLYPESYFVVIGNIFQNPELIQNQ